MLFFSFQYVQLEVSFFSTQFLVEVLGLLSNPLLCAEKVFHKSRRLIKKHYTEIAMSRPV